MEVSEHVAAVAEQGERLLAAAEAAGLGAAVPTCPGWAVADLLAHVGGVHRWAASFLETGRTTEVADEEEQAYFSRPPDGELLAWAREAHRQLVASLQGCAPLLECWTFLPAPSPLAFWARRQAHETAVHRVDAERALGRGCHIPAELAADGLDELLLGFFARPTKRLRADPPVVLGIELTDHAGAWTVRIGPDAVLTNAGCQGADCLLRGPASGTYQLMWNRLTPAEALVDVEGDPDVLELWRTKATVRWS